MELLLWLLKWTNARNLGLWWRNWLYHLLFSFVSNNTFPICLSQSEMQCAFTILKPQTSGDFPGWPVVKILCFQCSVPFLVGELRSHMPHGSPILKIWKGCIFCKLKKKKTNTQTSGVAHTCRLSRFSRVQLCAMPWTVAFQAPLSRELFRQQCWSRLPCPSPGDLPNPWIKPASLTSSTLAGGFFTTRATWETRNGDYSLQVQRDTEVKKRLLDSVGEGGMIWGWDDLRE